MEWRSHGMQVGCSAWLGAMTMKASLLDDKVFICLLVISWAAAIQTVLLLLHVHATNDFNAEVEQRLQALQQEQAKTQNETCVPRASLYAPEVSALLRHEQQTLPPIYTVHSGADRP